MNYGGEEITHPEILKAFNNDYPEIEVITATGHGSDLGARILAERRGDKFLVDLVIGFRDPKPVLKLLDDILK